MSNSKRAGLSLSWLFLLLALAGAANANSEASGSVAVVVYTQAGTFSAALNRVAQTRAEQILGDNKLTVLDQSKSNELKRSNRKLEDPGYLMTAEEFLKTSRKFQIDGIYRIYLNASVVRASTGYFTATANADLRYIDQEAKVKAVTTPVMGVKDNPPSDGLTDSAALANAVQRAVDTALEKVGMQILDATAPRLLTLDLVEVDPAKVTGPAVYAIPLSEADAANAKLAKRFFGEEEMTCLAQSPDKAAGAVGGLTSHRRGRDVSYKSEIHVVDLKDGKEMASYPTGSSRLKLGITLHDCLFVDNWRFLVAATGDKLYVWDTERNKVIAEMAFPDTVEKARLSHRRGADGSYLFVEADDQAFAYQLQVKGK